MHQFPENQNSMQQIKLTQNKKTSKINLIFNSAEIPYYIDRKFLKCFQRWDVATYSQNFAEIAPLKSHQKQNDAGT